jgi:hypothetical protein
MTNKENGMKTKCVRPDDVLGRGVEGPFAISLLWACVIGLWGQATFAQSNPPDMSFWLPFTGEVTVQPIILCVGKEPTQNEVEAAKSYFDEQMEFANKIFSQIGIQVKLGDDYWAMQEETRLLGPIGAAEFYSMLNKSGCDPSVIPVLLSPAQICSELVCFTLTVGTSIVDSQAASAGTRAGILLRIPMGTIPKSSYVLAHELGHILLDDALFTGGTGDKSEHSADENNLMFYVQKGKEVAIEQTAPTGPLATIDFTIMSNGKTEAGAMCQSKYVTNLDPEYSFAATPEISVSPFGDPDVKEGTAIGLPQAPTLGWDGRSIHITLTHAVMDKAELRSMAEEGIEMPLGCDSCNSMGCMVSCIAQALELNNEDLFSAIEVQEAASMSVAGSFRQVTRSNQERGLEYCVDIRFAAPFHYNPYWGYPPMPDDLGYERRFRIFYSLPLFYAPVSMTGAFLNLQVESIEGAGVALLPCEVELVPFVLIPIDAMQGVTHLRLIFQTVTLAEAMTALPR